MSDKKKMQGNFNPEDLSDLLHKTRDINSKDLFKNNVLASQFLRDYSGNSLFSDVQPEDLENQTEKFRLLLGVEVEGDTIIRVRIRIDEVEHYIYVIAVVEHKSYVDYDVSMQILLYMTVIWREYAREQNKEREGASKRKSFRYPLIFPIVYYEGTEKWTAGMHLSDRIEHAELAMEFVPDFTYRVVPLKDYDNDEFYSHNNEISLLMMINKINGPEDFAQFRKTARGFMESVFNNTTPDIQDLIIRVIWSLLLKMKVPTDEVAALLNNVREEKNMGVLFESFNEYDALEHREELKKTKEELKQAKEKADKAEAEADKAKEKADKAKEKADKAEAEADKAKEKADKAEAEADKAKEKADKAEAEADKATDRANKAETMLFNIRMNCIDNCQKAGKSKREACSILMTQCLMEEDEAVKFLDEHWA